MLGILLFPFVGLNAQQVEKEVSFDYETIDDFFEDIPSLNDELKSNEIILPNAAGFLIKNGNLFVNITMDDASSRDFYITVYEKQITGIYLGEPDKINYIVSTNEATVNSVIDAEEKVDSILEHYEKGNIQLKAMGFGNKVKLFFAKMFLRVST